MTHLTAAKQGNQRELRLRQTAVFLLWFVGGMALSRILYEGFFPNLLWLARPFVILPFAAVIAVGGTAVWQRNHFPAAALLPLLLNLLYLFDPAVNLAASRLFFFASLWLTALLLAHSLASRRAWRWLGVLFVLAALLPVYLLTMPDAVGQADTFEFQVVAPQLGIAHPTGYPLYLLLGKLFTLLPVKSAAWRLNFGTMLYGLTAVTLLFVLGYRMGARGITAVLGAVAFGLIPTFWSQAIEAEVYTLHTLIVVAAFLLMWEIKDQRLKIKALWLPVALAFVLGLGMTNHLTTLFLLPAAALTLLFSYTTSNRQSSIFNLKSSIILALAFLLPLLLYAYLPLRWQAVNHEPMGAARFVDWVIGGRFQGALQWRAWLDDLTRYEVIGRIYLTNWGWFNLGVALLGFIFILRRSWRVALILTLTWSAYTFYGLNYYVPDLDVFILGAQVVVAVWWMAGAEGILKIEDQRLKRRLTPNLQSLIFNLLIIILLLPTLLHTAQAWPRLDQSQDDGGQRWGEGVLALPLAEGAALLADSEKIAPLYYLQQAEGVRPDLEIMVLPDEAAYRNELDGRIAAGQPVYLARFLPGLEGIYHLRSVGPLTEVSREPLAALPETAVPTQLNFGPIRLIGYTIEPVSPYDEGETAVTLYWQAAEPVTRPLHVYLRLGGEATNGQHPANNSYPTNAWQAGEIVADFHALPRPLPASSEIVELEAALAHPFTPPADLEWQTVASFWTAEAPAAPPPIPLRQQIGEWLLDGADFPAQLRPQAELPVQLTGRGVDTDRLALNLRPAGASWPGRAPLEPTWPPGERPFFTLSRHLDSSQPEGEYEIIAYAPADCVMGECVVPASYCGWFGFKREGCVIGTVAVSGVALPETAVNFNDQIALLSLDTPDPQLKPGGAFDLTLRWTGLAPLDEDYTLFLQILDASDRIVGQVDAWPLQGTLPTSQWQPGQAITDPYAIQLDGSLPPGDYRLLVGWYLLADLHRLPVLDEDGRPVDDKLTIPGLFAE